MPEPRPGFYLFSYHLFEIEACSPAVQRPCGECLSLRCSMRNGSSALRPNFGLFQVRRQGLLGHCSPLPLPHPFFNSMVPLVREAKLAQLAQHVARVQRDKCENWHVILSSLTLKDNSQYLSLFSPLTGDSALKKKKNGQTAFEKSWSLAGWQNPNVYEVFYVPLGALRVFRAFFNSGWPLCLKKKYQRFAVVCLLSGGHIWKFVGFFCTRKYLPHWLLNLSVVHQGSPEVSVDLF